VAVDAELAGDVGDVDPGDALVVDAEPRPLLGVTLRRPDQ
jgi:hypothetical protein